MLLLRRGRPHARRRRSARRARRHRAARAVLRRGRARRGAHARGRRQRPPPAPSGRALRRCADGRRPTDALLGFGRADVPARGRRGAQSDHLRDRAGARARGDRCSPAPAEPARPRRGGDRPLARRRGRLRRDDPPRSRDGPADRARCSALRARVAGGETGSRRGVPHSRSGGAGTCPRARRRLLRAVDLHRGRRARARARAARRARSPSSRRTKPARPNSRSTTSTCRQGRSSSMPTCAPAATRTRKQRPSRYHDAAQRKGQPWALARAHRCLGLVADDFAPHFDEALVLHAETLDVFETARTRLAYGARLRRARQRVRAREHLQRSARERSSGSARRHGPRRRGAELAATGERRRVAATPRRSGTSRPRSCRSRCFSRTGKTTREAAAALFLSPEDDRVPPAEHLPEARRQHTRRPRRGVRRARIGSRHGSATRVRARHVRRRHGRRRRQAPPERGGDPQRGRAGRARRPRRHRRIRARRAPSRRLRSHGSRGRARRDRGANRADQARHGRDRAQLRRSDPRLRALRDPRRASRTAAPRSRSAVARSSSRSRSSATTSPTTSGSSRRSSTCLPRCATRSRSRGRAACARRSRTPTCYPKTESGSITTWIGVGGSPESVLRAARYRFPLMLAIIGGDAGAVRALRRALPTRARRGRRARAADRCPLARVRRGHRRGGAGAPLPVLQDAARPNRPRAWLAPGDASAVRRRGRPRRRLRRLARDSRREDRSHRAGARARAGSTSSTATAPCRTST